LLCSSFPRNSLLISGVVISHLLILLSFVSGSLNGAKSSEPETLIVHLAGERARSSVRKVASAITRIHSVSNEGRHSSLEANKAEQTFSPSTTEATSRLSGGNARQALYSPKPHYPLISRQLGEHGLVIVRLCVNEQGIVGEVGVSKTSGFDNLDHSALKALSQWRFSPITSSSTNFLLRCFQTPIQFTLEG
jgi:periplasmic protein TonB